MSLLFQLALHKGQIRGSFCLRQSSNPGKEIKPKPLCTRDISVWSLYASKSMECNWPWGWCLTQVTNYFTSNQRTCTLHFISKLQRSLQPNCFKDSFVFLLIYWTHRLRCSDDADDFGSHFHTWVSSRLPAFLGDRLGTCRPLLSRFCWTKGLKCMSLSILLADVLWNHLVCGGSTFMDFVGHPNHTNSLPML